MNALEVKEDGKAWLIIDCPVEPNHLDYKYQNEFKEWLWKSEYQKNNYCDNYDLYQKALASAERIEIDNQDVAWKLIPFKENSSSVFREHGIYPIPDLKWDIAWHCLKCGGLNCISCDSDVDLDTKVAVISLLESLPEKTIDERNK